ncbi:MAG: glycosyltransferase [Planctomycetales bacterium]
MVDNGSADGTAEFLRSCGDVRLISNAENRGFPAACNQGIDAARGERILLLNNDTLATPGWLARLHAALDRDAGIGLAGPCSNFVSGEQRVAVDYTDAASLEEFSREWARRNAGRIEETDRLVGFCLLFRREVVERIGGLDERFGIGNFEDDDFCLRALQAGYRAVIARDAFVHHYGGRTFVGSGVDFAGLMRQNERLFREKWETHPEPSPDGPHHSGSNGHFQDGKANFPTSIEASPPAKKACSEGMSARFDVKADDGGGLLLVPRTIKLSLCMIVRDNERTIRPCLESIRPWVDEMVVVDTGSKDRTPEICRELGARVSFFPWCDDFSAARNASLAAARGEWIFWMDSDDTIPPECGRKLRQLARGPHEPDVLGHVMQVHCPGPDGGDDLTVVDHVKLIRNRPDLRFEGRIHEQILGAIRRAGGDVRWSDVFVVHSGSDQTPAGRRGKLERDFRLLKLDLAERPEHPFVLFNLGMTHADAQQHDEAIDFLVRSIRVSQPGESHLRKAYALLVGCFSESGRHEQAWDTCREALERFPNDKELLFRSGTLHQRNGELREAERAFRRILDDRAERHFTSIDVGVVGHKARHNLALVYEGCGRHVEAEREWRTIIAERPGSRAAYRGLGGSLVKQGRFAAAGQLASDLCRRPELRQDGLFVAATCEEAQGELGAARVLLEQAVEEMPNDRLALAELCRVLFQKAEWRTAEFRLRQLADWDRQDAAARHNLATVCFLRGGVGEAIEHYRESLQLRPDHSATWQALAEALEAAGRNAEALDARRRAEMSAP